MINQVAREAGRDIYWSTRTLLTAPSSARSTRDVNLTENELLLNYVKQKKWSGRSRFSALCEDINEAIEKVDEEINPRSFSWREVYALLDERIDELKLSCTEEEGVELENLDKKNLVSYSVTLSRHRTWMESIMDQWEQSAPCPTSGKVLGLSIIGLASSVLNRGTLNAAAELICAFMWWSAFVYGGTLLAQGKIQEGASMIALGVGLYLFLLAGDFISLKDLQKRFAESNRKLEQLKAYTQSLQGNKI